MDDRAEAELKNAVAKYHQVYLHDLIHNFPPVWSEFHLRFAQKLQK